MCGHTAHDFSREVFNLKLWIALCYHLTACTYFPTPHMVSQLNMLQRVALRLTCWGLTRDILAEPEAMGGLGQAV